VVVSAAVIAGEVRVVSAAGAIQLEAAGVAYRRYAHPRDALLEWVLRRPRHTLFHALQGVSLSLQAGDSLGVVGDNGAGKSTFLKMLAGNLPPTSGRCEIHGRRSALLELGTGLQPEFSGVENARLGLALRGLSHADIERHLPEVLAFAELGEFAQQPVKTYSSGMVVRLVFAVAAVIEPEVLIVDEALSVGDQYFQKKSLDRMRAVLSNGATLVFCSHNLYQVREMCRKAVWLEQGRVRLFGDAQSVVDAYQDATRARNTVGADPRVCPLDDQRGEGAHGGAPLLVAVTLNHDSFQTHDPFRLRIQASQGNRPLSDVHVGLVIRRNDDVQCYGISTLHDGVQMQVVAAGIVAAEFVIERLPLLSGDYCVEVWLIDGSGVHVYDSRERCCPFRVQQAGQQQGVGMAILPHHWERVVEVVDALAC
jgi:lipopolysaccharide transport system ATP-binding protein